MLFRSEKIARKMGTFSEEKIWLLHDAALLHDIGKLGIHEMILNKKILSDEDWHAIRKHPVIGAEILKPVSLDKELLAVVSEHHERYDGKGYPYGLKGDEIDILAAIVAAADSYDAMVSHRSYKEDLTQAEAVTQLKANSGSQFNPEVIDAFIKVLRKET